MEKIRFVPSREEDQEDIHQRLRKYNRLFMRDFKDYSFHVEKEGQIAAGIVARSTFDTLEVEFLFVEEAFRGRGLGKALLSHAEKLAAEDGVKRVLVNTYSFQAPGFYEKMGYQALFSIDPCFGKYSQTYLIKPLSFPSGQREGNL